MDLDDVEVACRKMQSLYIGRLPIQDFPDDVLRLIFQTSVKATDKMKWTVSHVCQRWRSIALATPSLWSLLGNGTEGIPPSKPEAIRHAHLHSGATPLTVRCGFNGDEYSFLDYYHKVQTHIEELRLSSRDRWVELQFFAVAPDPSKGISLLQRLTGDLAEGHLTRLDLYRLRTDCRMNISVPLQALVSVASQVRVVELEAAFDERILRALPNSLRELTLIHLDLNMEGGINSEDILSIMASAPCLRCFSIIGTDLATGLSRSAHPPVVTHHHLESLQLGCLNEAVLLMERLQCPRLHHLDIWHPGQALSKQSTRLISQVRDLNFNHVPLAADCMDAFLEALCSVQRFAWEYKECDIDEFLVSPRSPSAMPALESLSIKLCTPSKLLLWLQKRADLGHAQLGYLSYEGGTEEDRQNIQPYARYLSKYRN